ncbi:hypothetical protein ACV4J1_002727 [Citrobacter sedlakii]
MKLYEMEGFLRGKCIPGDMKVNETNAEYLVRKFSEADSEITHLKKKLSVINSLAEAAEQASKLAQEATEKLVQERNALAAENAKLADCANFYRLGFKPVKGAFGIEYRPTEQLLDDCGNTAIEAIKTPATDAFLAEVRACARKDFIDRIEWIIRNECNPEKTETILNELQSFSETVRQEVAQ